MYAMFPAQTPIAPKQLSATYNTTIPQAGIGMTKKNRNLARGK